MTDAVLQQAIVDLGLVQGGDWLISRSGGRLDWLIDLLPVFLNALHLSRIAAGFWALFAHREPHQIAGMETAAIPLLAALLLAAPASRDRDGRPLDQPRPEPDGLGGADEIVPRQRRAAEREVMGDLRRVGRDAVPLRHDAQRLQPAAVRRVQRPVGRDEADRGRGARQRGWARNRLSSL